MILDSVLARRAQGTAFWETHFMINPAAIPTLAASQEARSQDALLVASLLHLMSHYSARSAGPVSGATTGEQPCVKLASVIERHLCALSRLPSIDPVLRATCEQLADQWAGVVDAKLPAPAPSRQPLLARFMKGGWPGKAAPLAG
jgi:hypothetical protein